MSTFTNTSHERTWSVGMVRNIYRKCSFRLDCVVDALCGYSGKLSKIKEVQ